MDAQAVTFANGLGELLAPFLLTLRSTGFFEAPVYIPAMTLLSILLFRGVLRAVRGNGTFDAPLRARLRRHLLVVYFAQCFLVTNATAVAFKTLIVEEMDYDRPHWFLPYVGPLHFYIASAAAAHLWLIWRNRPSARAVVLCAYVQIALLGGYWLAAHRLLYEPFDLLDVTTGLSGVLLLLWFGVLNLDIAQRALDHRYARRLESPPGRLKAHRS